MDDSRRFYNPAAQEMGPDIESRSSRRDKRLDADVPFGHGEVLRPQLAGRTWFQENASRIRASLPQPGRQSW